MGRPLLVLETIGAKSGQRRSTVLGWFPDTTDDSWLVVASYAGAARHPAWFLNMAKNPDRVWVKLGQRRFSVQPESLKGPDRAQAWQRVISLSPGYGNYQTKTDRELPIVRLKRVVEVG
jgi:deazaflavin-dependent oxidoreductase (nitroreductase family)